MSPGKQLGSCWPGTMRMQSSTQAKATKLPLALRRLLTGRSGGALLRRPAQFKASVRNGLLMCARACVCSVGTIFSCCARCSYVSQSSFKASFTNQVQGSWVGGVYSSRQVVGRASHVVHMRVCLLSCACVWNALAQWSMYDCACACICAPCVVQVFWGAVLKQL